MAGQDSKKKSPVALFFLAFAAIAVLMFIARYRSVLLHELAGPGGAEKLSTCGERLIAISVNEIYSWAWNDLSERPQISTVKTQKAVAMSSDRLLSIPLVADNLLVLSNLKGDKELGQLSLGEDKKCKLLQTSPNGKFAVAALVPAPVFRREDAGGDSDKQIQLVIIDPDLSSVRPVETKTLGKGLKLNDIGISNDGSFIAAVGGGDKGWLFVAGANGKQFLWEMAVEDCTEFNKVVFSPDGRTVYASESGRCVYIFDVTDRKLVKRLEMDKYKTPPNNPQTISCITVSPDGRLLAAASSPMSKVWIWDVKTGEKIVTLETSEFTICSIVFSPDSSLLAGTRGGDGPVKVWRVSK